MAAEDAVATCKLLDTSYQLNRLARGVMYQTHYEAFVAESRSANGRVSKIIRF